MKLEYIFLGVFTTWLFIISFFVGWVFVFFRKLSKDVGKGNLIKVVNKLIKSTRLNAKNLGQLEKKLKRFEEKGTYHIQKMALVRFNPFDEMGGDYSFSLTLLDGNDTGFIMTGLHTRERTRVYIKDVKKGKVKVELSKEENKALGQAQKVK